MHSPKPRVPAEAEQPTTGEAGEERAAQYLRSLGYEIRGRNMRFLRDEIDIVAFDPEDQVLVFCEVKTRTRSLPGYSPDLNLTPKKRTAMLRAARAYVAEQNWDKGYRLDAVLLAGDSLQHIRELDMEEAD